MSTIVNMPKLSATMDEATVVMWHKSAGEPVSAGEIILEIETDKTTLTIEAPAAGYLGQPRVAVGDSAAVGALLVTILGEGEQEQIDVDAGPSPPEAGAVHINDAVTEGSLSVLNAPPDPTDGVHRSRLFASPLARRIARETGVDLGRVRGSGTNGRIVRADVEAAPSTQVDRLRRQMVMHVTMSRREIPSFTLTRWIEMETVLSQIARLGRQSSATDYFLYALARAVDEVPQFRSVWNSRDMIPEDLRTTNIGVVVSTDNGLVIPVLSDVRSLDVAELAIRRKRVVAAARDGKLAQTDAQRASISLSSLLREDADEFEAIISPDQTAILAVGRIMERVVAHNEAVVVRRGCVAKLSVDHRVIDGRTGAKFIGCVARVLEGLERGKT